MFRRLLIALLAASALALVVVAAAAAQLPTDPPGGDPTTDPPVEPPKDARMTIAVKSGRVDRKTRWVLDGDKLLVKGHIWPFVKGQKVRLELYHSGKLVGTHTVNVQRDKTRKNAGKYQKRFRIHDTGRYSVIARHDATLKQEKGKSDREHLRSLPPRVRGEESTRLLQMGLRSMAYIAPLNGDLDDGTRRAVLAWRKVNRYERNGSPTSGVFKRIFHGEGRFKLRYGDPSKHVEGDLSRQVLVLVKHGKPDQIYTMSSGKPSTPTVQGTFNFYRKEPGSNSHGMYYSTYFHRGYAVHGYPSVPATYPASHGCFRVPMADAYQIYKSIEIGETIYVYD
jgi:lipoprotein-anchoring transpeptidase ErfK/SrfK